MPHPHVYLNGQFLPRDQASFDIEDRGTMFGDGVYEVIHFYAGQPFAMRGHLERLRQSLAAVRIDIGDELEKLPDISAQLVRQNATPDAAIYWQVTRGPAPRRHIFPAQPRPTVMVIAYPTHALDPAKPVPKARAILHDDLRWQRCHIKSLMLLPNVLAKNAAVEAGADEAILHRGQTITEGTSTNVFVVEGGVLRTHPADLTILGGITRNVVIELAGELGLKVSETAPTVAQLRNASEVLITGSTTQVAAVIAVDGQPVGTGQPGLVARKLHEVFVQRVMRECGL